jgi:hypothetical protein
VKASVALIAASLAFAAAALLEAAPFHGWFARKDEFALALMVAGTISMLDWIYHLGHETMQLFKRWIGLPYLGGLVVAVLIWIIAMYIK